MLPKNLKSFKRVSLNNIEGSLAKGLEGITMDIVTQALRKKVEVYKIFDESKVLVLKKGGRVAWIYKSLTSKTSSVGVYIAKNKVLSKEFLEKMGYPTPESRLAENISELSKITKKISFPVVVKPLSSAEGQGVTVNIRNNKLLRNSFEFAKKFDEKVLIEKQVVGDYYRITFIANGAYAATKNLPAFVCGNGKRSAKKLIAEENKNPERGPGGRLNKIKISQKTMRFLASNGFNLSSIIPKGRKVPLCFSGHDGGEYIDVTEKIHPYFLKLAKSITDNLGLAIVGIDIITRDISQPLNKNGGAVIEINASFPAFKIHSEPTQGKPRYLIPALIDYLMS
jgi:cyanophycin synthetase